MFYEKLRPLARGHSQVWQFLKQRVGPLGLFGLSLAMLGCSSAVTAVSPTDANSHQQPAVAHSATQAGQTLPISAQVAIANQVIQLEVAKTPQQQAMGLMYRAQLADNRGMIFPFAPARPVSFWMKNVVIPLDMVFVRDGTVQAVASNVPPCKTDPCPVYGPPTPIDQVIELRGGRAKELGLQVGDRVTVQYRPEAN